MGSTYSNFPNGASFNSGETVYANSSGFTGAHVGSTQQAVTAVSASGTIDPAGIAGYYVITKAGIGTITLAAPTATTHDGIEVTLVSKTAHAHLVTHGGTAGYNNNGTATDVATFGGAVGDGFVVFAHQGAWYFKGDTRNITFG